MTAEADALGPALAQLQLPVAAARCQQHIAVTDAADRLPVGLAGPAAGEEDEHEPAAQRRGQRQRENGAHRNVDDVEEPLLQAPLQRRHRLCCHGPLLAAVVPWGAVPLASMSPWTAVQGRQAGHPGLRLAARAGARSPGTAGPGPACDVDARLLRKEPPRLRIDAVPRRLFPSPAPRRRPRAVFGRPRAVFGLSSVAGRQRPVARPCGMRPVACCGARHCRAAAGRGTIGDVIEL